MGIEVETGNVFLIPLDDNSWALGQVISDWEGELYVAVYGDRLRTQQIDPRSIVAQKPIFLALTLDAKLWHGDWAIIGNVWENLGDLPQPVYRVGISGVMHIESRDRSTVRKATPSEIETLMNRTVSSPALIEEAVRAHFGLGDWDPHYDKLLAEYAYRSSELL